MSNGSSSMKGYLSSLKPISEKFTRIADKGGTDEETGKWVEGTMEEYVDKDAILEHFFLGDRHTPTRTKGENEEGWNQQKWDKGSSQWVDVSSDYEKTTTDPMMSRNEIRNITSWGAGGDFERKWDDWADEALPSDDFLPGGFDQVSNRLMIEQLKHSKDPNDIIIKKPEIGELKVKSVTTPPGWKPNQPVVYTLEDGSKWTRPNMTQVTKPTQAIAEGRMKPLKFYKAIFDPRGKKIAGGDLRSVGWEPYKSTDNKVFDGMREASNTYKMGK